MSPRRSSRLQPKSKAVPNLNAAKSDAFSTAKRSTKRRRVMKKVENDTQEAHEQAQGRRGMLQEIKEAPLDILFEIFGYLKPLDILNLSRTSKALRELLMNRTSAFAWRRSRQNIEGLPDLPPDLSEAQYANLAFNPCCHFCLAHEPDVMWLFRTRCCKECLPLNFQRFTQVMRDPQYAVLPYGYPSIAPHHFAHRGSKTPMLSLSHVERDRLEFEGIRGDENQPQQWLSDKAQETVSVREHATQCERWAKSHAEALVYEQNQVRIKRRDAIVAHLIDLGWGDEILAMPYKHLVNHKLVYEAEDLTEQIWSNIEAELVKFMEKGKKTRWNFAGLQRSIHPDLLE